MRASPKHGGGIEARTVLWGGAGQVAVAHRLGLRKQPPQQREQLADAYVLCSGQRVLGATLRVQATLIADADGAAVVRAAVRPHL